jgi:carnitine monooxygenase subunit
MNAPVTNEHTTARFPADLVSRVLQRMREKSYDVAPAPMTEPADIFLDEARWEAERRQFFRETPQVVGWAGEVAAPGSFTTKTVAGVPVLITRTEVGELKAFLNACTHRGAQVAQGCGSSRRFACPYHSWTFDLGGELVGQPESAAFEGINPEELGLQPLPIAEPVGLLVVGLSPVVDVSHALDGIESELGWCGYGAHEVVATRRFDVKANWKIVVDVNLEAYHIAALHRETLHPIAVDHSIHDRFGLHSRWAFPTRVAEKFLDVPESAWPAQFPISVVHVIYPGCVILETPVSSQMFRIYPGPTVGQTIVEFSDASLTPIHSEEERAGRMYGFDLASKIVGTEDFPVAEQCQTGAAAGLANFRFGRCEPMLQHWHRVWREQLKY